jgi:acyl-CoA hydrolase
VLTCACFERLVSFALFFEGGDLLELLERAALYCGKRFSGAECVSCVRIHGIHFRLPVQPLFLLRSIARVVHVGTYCIEVEVAVHIDRSHEGKPLEASHVGYFSIIPHNASGQSRPVTTGLDLAASSVDAKRAYVKAKLRLERQTFSLQDNAETFEKFLMAS